MDLLNKRKWVFWWLMRAKPALGLDITLNVEAQSAVPLDVLIPVHPKDLTILPHTVSGIRRNVSHPVNRIYVVTAETTEARRLCASLDCDLISESSVLPIGPSDIDYRPAGVDRSGWLYQQFLKLSADELAESDHCLVMDADTVLIRPQVFMWRGKCVLPVADELHTEYMRAYESIIGERPRAPHISFTSHHILVNLDMLRQLKGAIARRHGCAWYEAILRSVDREAHSGVSDYDLYGHWSLARNRRRVVLSHWRNIGLSRARLEELDALLPELARRYKAASFHHYVA